MRIVRYLIVFLALATGAWMTFDGSRALIAGDYFTPPSGELGPWSGVVGAIGIPPRSTSMKIIVVVFGLAWSGATAGFATGAMWGGPALVLLSVATLWYLPAGTLTSVLILLALRVLRVREPEGTSRAGAIR